jgi:hypothetical protein
MKMCSDQEVDITSDSRVYSKGKEFEGSRRLRDHKWREKETISRPA